MVLSEFIAMSEARLLGNWPGKSHLYIKSPDTRLIARNADTLVGPVLFITPSKACSTISARVASSDISSYAVSVGYSGGYVYLPVGGQIEAFTLDGGEYLLQVEEIQGTDVPANVLDTLVIPAAAVGVWYPMLGIVYEFMIVSPAAVTPVFKEYIGGVVVSTGLASGVWYPASMLTAIQIFGVLDVEITMRIAVPRPDGAAR